MSFSTLERRNTAGVGERKSLLRDFLATLLGFQAKNIVLLEIRRNPIKLVDC